MKKLLTAVAICFALNSFAQFPSPARDGMHPVALHQSRIASALTTCNIQNTEQWMASVNSHPTDTFCLGVTDQYDVEYWITTPGITQFNYFHQSLTTNVVYSSGWQPAGTHIFVPVDIDSYYQWVQCITGTDTCTSYQYGFIIVPVDPPYYCLPLQTLNSFPNPVSSSSSQARLNITFQSAAAGTGMMTMTNIQTGARLFAPLTINIRAGYNLFSLTTYNRPHGTYSLTISMQRRNARGTTSTQVLNRNVVIQ